MNKGWSVFFIVVLIVAAWGFYRGMGGLSTNVDSDSDDIDGMIDRVENIEISDNIEMNSGEDDMSSDAGVVSLDFENRSDDSNAGWNGEIKTFVMTGENFKFVMNGTDNPELKVNEGDKVVIEFTSTQGFHDWVVDEFSAATERVWAVNSTSVEFIADVKGTFEYYCSVGQHRANGMKGNLIVE